MTLVNDVLDLGKARAGKLELDTRTFSFLEALAPAMEINSTHSLAQSHGIRIVPILDPFLDVSSLSFHVLLIHLSLLLVILLFRLLRQSEKRCLSAIARV